MVVSGLSLRACCHCGVAVLVFVEFHGVFCNFKWLCVDGQGVCGLQNYFGSYWCEVDYAYGVVQGAEVAVGGVYFDDADEGGDASEDEEFAGDAYFAGEGVVCHDAGGYYGGGEYQAFCSGSYFVVEGFDGVLVV